MRLHPLVLLSFLLHAEPDPPDPSVVCTSLYANLAQNVSLRDIIRNNIGGSFGGDRNKALSASDRIAAFQKALKARLGTPEALKIENELLELAVDPNEIPGVRQEAIRYLGLVEGRRAAALKLAGQAVEESLHGIETEIKISNESQENGGTVQIPRGQHAIKEVIAKGFPNSYYWGEAFAKLRSENSSAWYSLLNRTVKAAHAGNAEARDMLKGMLSGDFEKNPDRARVLVERITNENSELTNKEKLYFLDEIHGKTYESQDPGLSQAFARASRVFSLPELHAQLKDLSTADINFTYYQGIWGQGMKSDPNLAADIFASLKQKFSTQELVDNKDLNLVVQTLLSLEGRQGNEFHPLQVPWVREYVEVLVKRGEQIGEALDRIQAPLSRITGMNLRKDLHELGPLTKEQYELWAPLMEAFARVRSQTLDPPTVATWKPEVLQTLRKLVAQKRAKAENNQLIQDYSQILAAIDDLEKVWKPNQGKPSVVLWNIFLGWNYRSSWVPGGSLQKVIIPKDLLDKLEAAPHVYGSVSSLVERFR